MTKDKQIEEMHKDVKRIHRCFLDDDDFDYLDEYIAVKLYKKGYRKSSEVAREIFEEIEKFMSPYRYPIIAELKKKYTESEGEG